ncbi:MAG: hypothetical protein ACE5HU_10385, partial [Acidobacteriota bacterium]
IYASAGWNPANEVAAEVLAFLDACDYPVRDLRPRPLPATTGDLAEYDVIVCLEEGASSHLQEIPFHTVVVAWEIGPPEGTAPPKPADEVLRKTREELSTRIADLMETLRGERAG